MLRLLFSCTHLCATCFELISSAKNNHNRHQLIYTLIHTCFINYINVSVINTSSSILTPPKPRNNFNLSGLINLLWPGFARAASRSY
ncbi:GSCOCG00007688001-RA-CDS [Cotesia congregata]|nr:GSCOCG00007688001-RA-CDS [Cotesia congregata]